jgi:UDP-glucose 6-dehydrogenase
MKKIYQRTGKQSELFPMTLEEAELVKMESNAINALWIAIQNSRGEFYELISERLGMNIDYERMTEVLTTMTEAYYNSLYGTSAGIFFGGTCLKKDPNALHAWAEDQHRVYSHFTRFLEVALRMNQALQKRILNDHIMPKTIAVKGLPKRLMERDHPTYENIRKIKIIQQEIEDKKQSMIHT